MKIKQKRSALLGFLLTHQRKIVLSLILLYTLNVVPQIIVYSSRFPAAGPAVGILAVLIYLVLLWLPASIVKAYWRGTMILLSWLMTLLYCQMSSTSVPLIVFVFYLIGYATLRLPLFFSVLLGVMMISGDALIFFLSGVQKNDILVASVLHMGTYIIFWGVRVRREATQSRMLHYEQLQAVHTELEQAHHQLQHTHNELEEATVQLLRYAVLEERTRISRDLHDSIGHGLTSVIVQLQALPFMMKSDAAEGERSLRTVLDVARHCLQDVRSVVRQMATDEARLGFVALQSLVKQVQEQAGLTIELSADEDDHEWGTEISELLYRVLQEALTNVIRHAGASHVEVGIISDDRGLTLTVADNGIWQAATTLQPGFGLTSMEARCERAGGTLTIQGVQPHGMRLVVTLPLGDEEERQEERA
ncbi:sensor histidine kinase [Paenibacillus agri]|uniref:histidine kinase n=1 Tax=Paenibacillus agri TaxID=2744309 RepID=A0A850ELX2_9BACL|nr:sensor histidine kinase [Paenibacillus agri]NUU60729.1 sensor histidine kinase [Paenibacillus agri]